MPFLLGSENMDSTNYLHDAAVFYKDNLANRRFEITIIKKQEERNIEFLFLPQHFYHLIGLHKLIDLSFLKRSSTDIYKEILDGKLTYSDISQSKHITLISDRIIHHREMFNILKAESLFFRSLHGRFKGVISDCVLTKEIDSTSIFSFLFFKQDKNVYFPCSFFTRNEQKEYTKEGTRWKIISVRQV